MNRFLLIQNFHKNMRVNQSNIATFYIAITIAGSLARAWIHIIVQMYLPAGMSCMYVMYEYYMIDLGFLGLTRSHKTHSRERLACRTCLQRFI